MPKISIKVLREAVIRRLRRAGEKMDAAVKTEVSRSAYEIAAEAKRRAPVRTGRLRDSIGVRFEAGGRAAAIGTSVPYARFQRRKFLQPAARSERPKLLERLSERLAEAGA